LEAVGRDWGLLELNFEKIWAWEPAGSTSAKCSVFGKEMYVEEDFDYDVVPWAGMFESVIG